MSIESLLERIATSLEILSGEKAFGPDKDKPAAVDTAKPGKKPKLKVVAINGTPSKKGNGADVPSKDDVRQALVNLAQVTGSNEAPRDVLKEFNVKTVPQLKEDQHADIIGHIEGLIGDIASQ